VRRSLSKRVSRNKEEELVKTAVRCDGAPTRRTQSTGEGGAPAAAVTVITIGSDNEESGGILPSVLRDKPRITSTPGKIISSPTLTTNPTQQQHFPNTITVDNISVPQRPNISSRPDVADVVAVSCTPPPDIGGVTSGDERVQIYVPSPQTTPYSTIGKHDGKDTHRSVTLLNFTRQQETVTAAVTGAQMESLKTDSESYMAETEMSVTNTNSEQNPEEEAVSISQVYIQMNDEQQQETST